MPSRNKTRCQKLERDIRAILRSKHYAGEIGRLNTAGYKLLQHSTICTSTTTYCMNARRVRNYFEYAMWNNVGNYEDVKLLWFTKI